MKELEEVDPDTRQLLLAKAIADLGEEVPVCQSQLTSTECVENHKEQCGNQDDACTKQ